MLPRASCRYLTHPYPAYLGCTFSEVCVISMLFFMLDVIFSVVCTLLWHGFFLWLIGFFAASLFLIKLTAKAIGNFKAHKPAGYLGLKIRKILQVKWGIVQPFINQVTRWNTRRHLS